MTIKFKTILTSIVAVMAINGCTAPEGVNPNVVTGATVGAVTGALNATARGADMKEIATEAAIGATVGGLSGMAMSTNTTTNNLTSTNDKNTTLQK
ncbi:MAG: hypothetical protein IE881_05375 [Epsilonproteobacteria bacterium]|jgi:hypothetical protein|nr:hypothetical protein [Campylobacterota bacterium]